LSPVRGSGDEDPTGPNRPVEPHSHRADSALPVDPDLALSDPAQPTPGATGHPHHAPPSAGRARLRPGVLVAIALGAALGAPARYGMAQVIHVAPGSFPWATFVTNVSGSFALGLAVALIVERFPPSRYLRPFVATGFLGAYTTYSTFAVEADLLVKEGHAAIGVAYAVASLVAGFAAVWAGIVTARRVPVPNRQGMS
jgi:fluoride exporter